MWKSIQTKVKEWVIDWCERMPIIGHTSQNPKFFITEGWVSAGAKDFMQHATPKTSPCVQMDSTRSVSPVRNDNDKFEVYAIDLYFCVRSAKMADGMTDDEALDEADYIRQLFKCHYLRERDEVGVSFLQGSKFLGGSSVPLFHDGWVAFRITLQIVTGFNKCLDEGLLEENKLQHQTN